MKEQGQKAKNKGKEQRQRQRTKARHKNHASAKEGAEKGDKTKKGLQKGTLDAPVVGLEPTT